MKTDHDDDMSCSIQRTTIRVMKVAAWILALAVTWWLVRAVWTVFCSIDFNPILRP